MYKKNILIMCFLLLTNCATSGTAFLGPILTGAKTGSVYQASLSYSTGKMINELTPQNIKLNNMLNIKKKNNSLPDIPYTEHNPIIITYYKVELVKSSEVFDPEPLP